jgi:hypothetical protein
MALDPVTDGDAGGSLIHRVLELARNQLLLDVAWLAELADDRLVVRAIAGDASSFGLYDGWSCPSGSESVAAIANGADYLVIGRPITEAPDPVAALALINASLPSTTNASLSSTINASLPKNTK